MMAEHPALPAHRRGLRTFLIVATVILTGALGLAVGRLLPARSQTETAWNRVSTGPGETREISLPDGSTIWLNAESEVFYPSEFKGSERKIFAGGEIYADIAKDPDRIFLMETGTMNIRVFGTRFNVRTYADSDISEVFLDEGSISADIEGYGAEVKMRPGELVRYSRSASSLEKYTYDTDKYATWTQDSRLVIVNMRLQDIVGELERRFGVRISIATEGLKGIRYYASFINNESLQQILSGLNNDGRLHFRGDDKNIIIY